MEWKSRTFMVRLLVASLFLASIQIASLTYAGNSSTLETSRAPDALGSGHGFTPRLGRPSACIPGASDITLPIIRDMPASESTSARAASAVKSAIGGLLGGGGGMFGGGNPFGGSGGGARMVRKPKGPWDGLARGKTAIKLGGWIYKPRSKKVQPQIRIAQDITDSPFEGGPDSMWLQDGNGNILRPIGYMIFEIWRHWRLTITITRETYVNGELVSRSVTRESTQWKELVDRYKMILQAPSIWERLQARPFGRIRGVIAEFPLPEHFDPSKWSLITHVTSKETMNGKEVIKTVPFVANIVQGEGKRLRFKPAPGGRTRYQQANGCPPSLALSRDRWSKIFAQSSLDMGMEYPASGRRGKAGIGPEKVGGVSSGPHRASSSHKVKKVKMEAGQWARIVILQRQPLQWLKQFHALEQRQQLQVALAMSNLAFKMLTGINLGLKMPAQGDSLSDVARNLAIEASSRWETLDPEQKRGVVEAYSRLSPELKFLFANEFITTLAINLFLDLRMPHPVAYAEEVSTGMKISHEGAGRGARLHEKTAIMEGSKTPPEPPHGGGLVVRKNGGNNDEPVIHSPERQSACTFSVSGAFEPAQGVWQDDIVFSDMPTKQLKKVGKNKYHAELNLVAGRPTLLFGTRSTNHNKIHVDVKATGSGSYFLQPVVKLRDSKGVRELYRGHMKEIRCTRSGKVYHDFDIVTANGIPGKPFTVAAGGYSIWIEVIGVGGGKSAGKIEVTGKAVKTHSPNVVFLPFTLNRKNLNTRQHANLIHAAAQLDAASKKFIPDYFPLKPGGFRSLATPGVWSPGKISPFKIPEKVWKRGGKAAKKFVRDHINEAITARIENLIFKYAHKFERRVVLVMPQGDFGTLVPGAVAATFSTPHKVIFAQANTAGSHWDIAHEIAHALPLHAGKLWIPYPACHVYYHNGSGRVAAGHQVTLGGRERRARHDKTPSIMSSWPVPTWISQCTYWHLLNVLSKPRIPDPELLLIRGYLLDIKGDGKADVGWLIPAFSDMGEPSEPTVHGRYYVSIRDASGKELARHHFEPFWLYSDERRARIVSINLAVPSVPGAARIEIHGPHGLMHVLSAGVRTPSIRITQVDIAKGKVNWEAHDPDGDALTFMVSLSMDGGRSWIPVGETRAMELDIDPALLQAKDARLEVLASDGIHSGAAVIRLNGS